MPSPRASACWAFSINVPTPLRSSKFSLRFPISSRVNSGSSMSPTGFLSNVAPGTPPSPRMGAITMRYAGT